MFMSPDKKNLSNYYPIMSLYFDTNNFDFYEQKIEGLQEHNKVRLRQYKSYFDKGEKVYLESKQKRGMTQIKKRVFFSTYSLAIESLSDTKTYFGALNLSKGLQPTVLVKYERLAYESFSDDRRLRVTFDRNLKSEHPNSIMKNSANILEINGNEYIIMEVKYSEKRLPLYLTKILKYYNFQNTSISKYQLGLDFITGRSSKEG